MRNLQSKSIAWFQQVVIVFVYTIPINNPIYLPTPVGPKKAKVAIGFEGSDIPALDRWIASATTFKQIKWKMERNQSQEEELRFIVAAIKIVWSSEDDVCKTMNMMNV